MRVRRTGLFACVAVALAALGPSTGHAQPGDDWSITREPGTRPTKRPARGPRTPRPPRVAPAPEATAPAARDRNDVLIERYRRILLADPRESFAFQRLLDLYRERDGNVDRLVAELEGDVAADAGAYAQRMLLGHLYRAQSRIDDARAQYTRAMELRAADPAPVVALAHLERAADPPRAREHYARALSLVRDATSREELLREAAGLALDQGDYDGARALYAELAGPNGSVYLRSEHARALAERRLWDRAVQEYRRVAQSLRGDNRVLPPVLLALARAELEAGDPEESLRTLDRALAVAGREAGIRMEIYEQMLAAYRRTERLPELAERLERTGGSSFEALSLLGQIEDELGRDEAALAAYRRALRARSRDLDTRLRITQILSRSGRLDEVIAEYRELIRAAPREPRFVVELAQLLVQTDRRADALRLVQEIGRRNANDPSLHQQLAELYTRWGEQELAAREVELLARIDPQDPAHLLALGSQQFGAGQRDQAIATWRRVLEIPGERADAFATLGGIFADHDLLPQAVEAYREAVRLRPDDVASVRALATTLERDQQHAEAEREWQRVLALAGDDLPARREARERIVGLWLRQRQIPARLQELERRFAADPPDVEAGRFAAEVYRRWGAEHRAQAEQALARVIELAPGDVESLLALERLRAQRGDRAGAIEVLRRLRDADARRASSYLQRMAEHALALYRDEEAIEYAAEAVRRNPDDAAAHRRLADLYRARQDAAHAIESYRRALELNDRLYPVYFDLAEIHVSRGETEQADRLYRRVLAIAPDDDLVVRAGRASIQIHLGAGTLVELERELLPLALGHPQRPIFRRMAVELYDAYASPLVLRARRGGPGSAEARAELRRLGSRAIKPLLEALADPDPAQRRVALEILGDLGNPSAAAPLVALAQSSSLDLTQRTQAILAAASLATEALVPRFASLAQGSEGRLRAGAAWALARIGGREALRALRRLSTSSDPEVRAYALLGLGLHGGSAAVPELARIASDEPREDLALAATWALGRAGGDPEAPLLASVLTARGGSVAEVAADALGEVGGEQATAALARALFAPDPRLRRAVARALRGAQLGREQGSREQGSREQGSREQGSRELPTPSAFERASEYVLRIVQARDGGPAPPDLGPLVTPIAAGAAEALHASPERALAALAVLSARPEGLGLGELTADMQEWPEPARERAEAALSRLTDALVEPVVEAALRGDLEIRVEAVRLLARLSHPLAARAVAEALADGARSVQRAALDALAATTRAPSEDESVRLQELLRRDREWPLRMRAARALGRVQSEPAAVALREALATDAFAFVREAAAQGLSGRHGERDLSALLSALAEDREPRVRAAAGRALASSPAAERARALAAQDPHPDVRGAVR